MSKEDESLRQYRDAVRAYPELDVNGAATPSDETVLSKTPPARAYTSTSGSPFPPNFEILDKIAETQLSTTWKALDHERKAPVVIKEPHSRLLLDEDALQRFRREVQLVSKFNHANIVPILATHLSEPPYFYTMPLIEGEHLDRFCEQRNLSITKRLLLFLKVCRAVGHAHQHGVIHRDLKPNNILVDEDGEPQLLDFGLGRAFEPGTDADKGEHEGVMGAPGYMAPEQAAGLSGDTRTDVYSLGVILFQLLTRRLPVTPTRDLNSLLRRIREEPAIDPVTLNPKLGRELNAVLLKALAKDPALRYQSVADLTRDIETFLAGGPVSAVPNTSGYVAGKWLRRNLFRVTAAIAIIAAAIAVTVGWYTSVLNAAEAGRHTAAVLSGRLQTRVDDPVNASVTLWGEQLKYDSLRTRYALWEHYRRYPSVYFVGGHGRQTQVEYSPDGEWIVSVCKDERKEDSATGRLIVYEAATGKICQTVPAQRAHALSICFSPAGNRVFVGGTDGRIRAWSFEEDAGTIAEEPSAVLKLDAGSVRCVAVSPDDRWLAAGTEAGLVYLFNVSSADDFQQVYHWDGLGTVTDLAFSAKSGRLAASAQTAGAKDQERPGGVWVWRLDDWQLAGNRTDDDGPCRGVMFSEDSTEVVVGSGGLYRWDPLSNIKTDLVGAATWGVRSVDSVNNETGRYIVFSVGAGRVYFYDMKLERLCIPQGFHDSAVADHIAVCCSPDGRHVASVGRDGLRVWDFLPAHEIELVDENDRNWEVTGIALSENASALVAWMHKDIPESTKTDDDGPATADVSGHGRLVIHHISQGRRAVFMGKPGEALGPAALATDGKRIGFAITDPVSGTSRLAVSNSTFSCDELYSPAFLGKPFKAIRWVGGDGVCLLCVLTDGSLVIWRVQAAHNADVPVLERVEGFAYGCSSVSEGANGEWLVANEDRDDAAGRVKLWRSTGRSLDKYRFDQAYELASDFPAHDYTWCAALLENGKGGLTVATVGSVYEVHLWHPMTGEPLGKLSGHRNAIDHCRALDERLLVTAAWDGTVRIWDLVEREEVCILHEDRPKDSPFAVAGGCVAVAKGDTVTIAETREIARFIAGNETAIRGRRGE